MRITGILVLCALASLARAQAPEVEEDSDPRLVLGCNYVEGRQGGVESTTIRSVRAKDRKAAEKAATVQFRKGTEGKAAFAIDVGEAAECIYPSGRRVRVKVGVVMARGHGRCGADPQIFLSIWVDRRKIESREWFAGHCYEGPLVSYELNRWWVRKCKAMDASKVDVCVSFPGIERFPVDLVEYPLPGKKRPALGEIEVVRGTHPVCAFARDAVRASWSNPFEKYHPAAKPKPEAEDEDEEGGADDESELRGASASRFDFDNDGKVDVVFERLYESTYMDGNVLLVKLARPAGVTWFLPCQLDRRHPAMKSCPPFSQDYDEAGFGIRGSDADSVVYFRGRYTTATPFRYGKTTFLALTSSAEDTLHWVSILKTRPGSKVNSICLIRKVTENY